MMNDDVPSCRPARGLDPGCTTQLRLESRLLGPTTVPSNGLCDTHLMHRKSHPGHPTEPNIQTHTISKLSTSEATISACAKGIGSDGKGSVGTSRQREVTKISACTKGEGSEGFLSKDLSNAFSKKFVSQLGPHTTISHSQSQAGPSASATTRSSSSQFLAASQAQAPTQSADNQVLSGRVHSVGDQAFSQVKQTISDQPNIQRSFCPGAARAAPGQTDNWALG